MVDPMLVMVQSSRLFLTAVTPITVAPTTVFVVANSSNFRCTMSYTLRQEVRPISSSSSYYILDKSQKSTKKHCPDIVLAGLGRISLLIPIKIWGCSHPWTCPANDCHECLLARILVIVLNSLMLWVFISGLFGLWIFLVLLIHSGSIFSSLKFFPALSHKNGHPEAWTKSWHKNMIRTL